MKITTIALAVTIAMTGTFAIAQSGTGATPGGTNSAAGGQGTGGSTQGGQMNNSTTSSPTGSSTGGMTSGSSQKPASNDLSKSANPDAVQSKQGSPGGMGK